MKYCQSEMKPKINRLLQQTHIARRHGRQHGQQQQRIRLAMAKKQNNNHMSLENDRKSRKQHVPCPIPPPNSALREKVGAFGGVGSGSGWRQCSGSTEWLPRLRGCKLKQSWASIPGPRIHPLWHPCMCCRLFAARLGPVRVALPLLAKSLADPTSASSDWVARRWHWGLSMWVFGMEAGWFPPLHVAFACVRHNWTAWNVSTAETHWMAGTVVKRSSYPRAVIHLSKICYLIYLLLVHKLIKLTRLGPSIELSYSFYRYLFDSKYKLDALCLFVFNKVPLTQC